MGGITIAAGAGADAVAVAGVGAGAGAGSGLDDCVFAVVAVVAVAVVVVVAEVAVVAPDIWVLVVGRVRNLVGEVRQTKRWEDKFERRARVSVLGAGCWYGGRCRRGNMFIWIMG